MSKKFGVKVENSLIVREKPIVPHKLTTDLIIVWRLGVNMKWQDQIYLNQVSYYVSE